MRTTTTLLFACPLACLLGAPAALADDDGWQEASKSDGIVIYNRARPGSDIKEVRAIGVVDAPSWVLKNVIDDPGRYKEFMPFTEESAVVKREPGSVVTYQRLDTPIVAKRDYTIRVKDESRRLPDGRVVYKNAWSQANHLGPPEQRGVVRVKVNEGYWLLEDQGGKRTRITYYLYTDPGGSLPSFIINTANSSAVPDLFRAVERAARDGRYQKAKPALPNDAVTPPTAIEAAKN